MERDKKGRFVKGHIPWHKGKRNYINCLYCGKEIRTFPSRPRKYCSHSCELKYEWKEGIRDKKIIKKIHGKHFKGYKNKGTFIIGDKRISKENNFNWKGGISKLNKLIRSLPEYKIWRKAVFERDNWTCKVCGKNKCLVEAHHLKQLKVLLMLNQIKTIKQARVCGGLWVVDNGQTLCQPCHNKTK